LQQLLHERLAGRCEGVIVFRVMPISKDVVMPKIGDRVALID